MDVTFYFIALIFFCFGSNVSSQYAAFTSVYMQDYCNRQLVLGAVGSNAYRLHTARTPVYPKSFQCQILIQAPAQDRVLVRFERFDVRGMQASQCAGGDFVQFIDGATNMPATHMAPAQDRVLVRFERFDVRGMQASQCAGGDFVQFIDGATNMPATHMVPQSGVVAGQHMIVPGQQHSTRHSCIVRENQYQLMQQNYISSLPVRVCSAPMTQFVVSTGASMVIRFTSNADMDVGSGFSLLIAPYSPVRRDCYDDQQFCHCADRKRCVNAPHFLRCGGVISATTIPFTGLLILAMIGYLMSREE